MQVQRTLDDERSSFQEQLWNLRSQHEAAFEAEEKKYQRRLTSLQERLNAKDKEYAEIFEKEQQLNPTTDSDVEKEKIIESLNIQIAKHQEEMAKLRESNSESEDEHTDDEGTLKEQASDSFCICYYMFILNLNVGWNFCFSFWGISAAGVIIQITSRKARDSRVGIERL